MRNFLCKLMGTLVISAALFSLAPKAAADGIVTLPNGTLTGVSSFTFGTSSDIYVTAPLSNQTPDLIELFEAGKDLPQVVVEIFWPGTNSPEETLTLQNCLITSLTTNSNSGTETVGFLYERITYSYSPEPPPVAPVPEPGSLGLIVVGLVALIGLARKAW